MPSWAFTLKSPHGKLCQSLRLDADRFFGPWRVQVHASRAGIREVGEVFIGPRVAERCRLLLAASDGIFVCLFFIVKLVNSDLKDAWTRQVVDAELRPAAVCGHSARSPAQR